MAWLMMIPIQETYFREPRFKSTTNHGGGIRQTPGSVQKQPCHLPEETGVQLLCAASYDIWCRDLDTHQRSTKQTCGCTDQKRKNDAQHGIQRQKDQHLGQGENKSNIHFKQCEKNEMVMGRAHQLPQTSKTTDRPLVSLRGDHTKSNDDIEGDQPSG